MGYVKYLEMMILLDYQNNKAESSRFIFLKKNVFIKDKKSF